MDKISTSYTKMTLCCIVLCICKRRHFFSLYILVTRWHRVCFPHLLKKLVQTTATYSSILKFIGWAVKECCNILPPSGVKQVSYWKIIQLSSQSGVISFPSAWLNYSIVKPLLKKGDKNNVTNYRPISLLTSFSKVFEKNYIW